LLIALLGLSGRLWAAVTTHHASRHVDQTSMLIWCMLDYFWCTHWTSVSELFKCGSQR
jgi:hypothetical protein